MPNIQYTDIILVMSLLLDLSKWVYIMKETPPYQKKFHSDLLIHKLSQWKLWTQCIPKTFYNGSQMSFIELFNIIELFFLSKKYGKFGINPKEFAENSYSLKTNAFRVCILIFLSPNLNVFNHIIWVIYFSTKSLNQINPVHLTTFSLSLYFLCLIKHLNTRHGHQPQFLPLVRCLLREINIKWRNYWAFN